MRGSKGYQVKQGMPYRGQHAPAEIEDIGEVLLLHFHT